MAGEDGLTSPRRTGSTVGAATTPASEQRKSPKEKIREENRAKAIKSKWRGIFRTILLDDSYGLFRKNMTDWKTIKTGRAWVATAEVLPCQSCMSLIKPNPALTSLRQELLHLHR